MKAGGIAWIAAGSVGRSALVGSGRGPDTVTVRVNLATRMVFVVAGVAVGLLGLVETLTLAHTGRAIAWGVIGQVSAFVLFKSALHPDRPIF